MDTLNSRLAHAQEILGYHFNDTDILRVALTHPSAAEGHEGKRSYERLEFLGDSVLGAIVAKEAYVRYPKLDEGGLTRIKVSLVSGAHLSKLAEEMGLGDSIIFGSSENGTGKRGMHSALENVYESLVAAILLDGGFVEARSFVERTLLPLMDESMANEPENPKSTLQELLQVHRITPTYDIIETQGPPHDRSFVACVMGAKVPLAIGEGHSKKEAEAAAARAALDDYDACLAKALAGAEALHDPDLPLEECEEDVTCI